MGLANVQVSFILQSTKDRSAGNGNASHNEKYNGSCRTNSFATLSHPISERA